MRRAEATQQVAIFEDLMDCIKTAAKEINKTHKEIEVQKSKVKDEINELMAMIDEIPEK